MGDRNEEQVRRERVNSIIEMANQLRAKLLSLGVKRKSVTSVATDLSDAYAYAGDVKKYIELLLHTDSYDWDKLEDIFVELRVITGELRDHIIDSRKPLEYLADYCCRRASLEDK